MAQQRELTHRCEEDATAHEFLRRFSVTEKADVTLRLLSTNEESITLHLHSQVLRRSDFFEARLSERWDLDRRRPFQLTLAHRKNIDACKRCIELMYVPQLKHAFTSVQDALDVLEVAAELLFQDCIDACLCFLECVPWIPEDEMAIRSTLASSNVRMTEDLVARVFMPSHLSGCHPAEIMEDRLRLLFSHESGPCRMRARADIRQQLEKNVHPSAPSAFARINEVILHEEWHRNLELLKAEHKRGGFLSCSYIYSNLASKPCAIICTSLEWLLESCLLLKIGDDVVKTLAEEDLPELLAVCNDSENATAVLSMLEQMLQAFQSGELLISRSIRLALVKNWLPVIRKLICNTRKRHHEYDLEKGLCALTETLTQVDQSEIFKIWYETCFEEGRFPWPDLKVVFELSCDKLRQALQSPHKERESLCCKTSPSK